MLIILWAYSIEVNYYVSGKSQHDVHTAYSNKACIETVIITLIFLN
jgi:hypothetical protein